MRLGSGQVVAALELDELLEGAGRFRRMLSAAPIGAEYLVQHREDGPPVEDEMMKSDPEHVFAIAEITYDDAKEGRLGQLVGCGQGGRHELARAGLAVEAVGPGHRSLVDREGGLAQHDLQGLLEIFPHEARS